MNFHRKTSVGRMPLLSLMLATTPAVLAMLAAPSAYAQTQARSFAIDSQPLSSALLELGRQAEISILAPTSLVGGKTSQAVRGELTVSAALDQLLQGSGLSYVFVQPGAVKIVAQEAALNPATAAESQDNTVPDRVVVTGTNIRGVYPNSTPVEVYTREDIERTGAVTTEQFIGKMPQNLGTFSQYGPGAGNAGVNLDAVTAIDLRGLGAGTTLTLLNGRRIALSNGGRSADVSLIPAGAIERVEVLTDGASAIYGSDAVGGVVNFILRDDFEGAETRLTYGGVSEGGLRQGSASQTFGARWSGGHGLAAYNYHSASALKTSDRSYAAGAGPGNLTPVDARHNLFATFSQNVTGDIMVGGDFGIGRRKTKNSFSTVTSPAVTSHSFASYAGTTEQVFGALEVDYAGPAGLDATASISYSEVDTDGAASITLFNLVPPVTTANDFSSRNSQLDVLGKVSGVLATLPAGDVRFSVGGGMLEEKYRGISPTTNRQSIGTLGRRSYYGFAEVYAPLVAPAHDIPLVHSLSLNVAARYTEYADRSSPALDRDFGDSLDPKIGLAWFPIEALNIRASYGSSFRAPSLTQLDSGGGFHFLTPQTVAGSPAVIVGVSGYAVDDLGPETADTYTVGFDYRQPGSDGFRISATYYSIDYTDRIGVAPTGGLNPFVAPELVPDLIYRPPSVDFLREALTAAPLIFNGTSIDLSDPQVVAAGLFARDDVWIMDTRFRNLAVSRQDGIDVTVSETFPTSLGDLQVGANVTHILSYVQKGSISSPAVIAVDRPGQPADWRGRAYANLSAGSLTGTLSVNYVDSYANVLAPSAQQRIDDWTTVDLSLQYALMPQGAGSGGTRLSLSIQNLLDAEPPRLLRGAGSNINNPIGFDPANANPLGRFIVVGLSHTW
jgi:iron complex outermembrane receptor protein